MANLGRRSRCGGGDGFANCPVYSTMSLIILDEDEDLNAIISVIDLVDLLLVVIAALMIIIMLNPLNPFNDDEVVVVFVYVPDGSTGQ